MNIQPLSNLEFLQYASPVYLFFNSCLTKLFPQRVITKINKELQTIKIPTLIKQKQNLLTYLHTLPYNSIRPVILDDFKRLEIRGDYKFIVSEFIKNKYKHYGTPIFDSYSFFDEYFVPLEELEENWHLRIQFLLTLVLLNELYQQGSIEHFKEFSQYYETVLKDKDLDELYEKEKGTKVEDIIWSTHFEYVYNRLSEIFG